MSGFLRGLFVICIGALSAAAVIGCSTSGTSGSGASGSSGGGMMGGGASPGASSSVGERIFLTGVGADGQTVPHSAPAVSQGSLMMGGGGCGSCHGADGRGGTIKMMTGTGIDAPDVTYDALIAAGFTDATIRAAIRDGVDEAGRPLDEAMPRWQMGAADLDATIAYLKTLSAP
jgi:mono/diheme cytochrome c family protein